MVHFRKDNLWLSGLRTQGEIPLPLKRLRSFQRKRTAFGGSGSLPWGIDTFHFMLK
ncbi:MAG: hypothetical protein KAQ69_11150 [Spirochaetales bacterium]|nr:hypothetical protein [Spirochaetales bacterium]